MQKHHYPFIFIATAFLIFILLFIHCLVAAQEFLRPLALAILFSYLLYPIAKFFESRGMARIVANFLSILITIAILAGGIYLIYRQLDKLIGDLPTLKNKVMHNIDSVAFSIEQKTGISQDSQKVWLKKNMTTIIDTGGKQVAEIFSATTGTIVRIALMPVFVFLMLFYRDKAEEFIFMLTKENKKVTMQHILYEISYVARHYVGGIAMVMIILMVLDTVGLWVIGVEYPLILGVIAGICGIIPYFGNIVGFGIPLLFTLFSSSNPHFALRILPLFFIVQFTENNILTPNIVGDNVKLNPFVIILSLMAAASVWGVGGMVVIVPLMAMVRIVCENVESLHPYGFLLGTKGTEKHSLSIDKIKNLFKRFHKK